MVHFVRRGTDGAEAVRRYGERGRLLRTLAKGPKLALRGDGGAARQAAHSSKAPAADVEMEVSAVKDEPMPDAAEAKEPDVPVVADPTTGALFSAYWLERFNHSLIGRSVLAACIFLLQWAIPCHAGDPGTADSDRLANGSAKPAGAGRQSTAEGDAQKDKLMPEQQHASPDSAAALLAAYAVFGESALPHVPASPLYAIFL